jgi:hypothetical protein
MGQFGLAWSSVAARSQAEGCHSENDQQTPKTGTTDGKPEGQARSRAVEVHLVILVVVLLLKHRLGVLCDESIHLEIS